MSSSTSHATLRYTTMRLGIFVGCLVVVGLLTHFGIVPAGVGKSNPIWVVLLALILSAPLSYVLLRKQRAAMAEQIAGGVGRAKERLAANQTQEDEVQDPQPQRKAEPPQPKAEPRTGSA
ncbi:DUF4229 domain-containing protein [Streptomyces sp. 891-h]|uniref:DUF4229 domain-containing protein n=1 Tax=unclassified Streptomyces TaxID=2593676 RepID=UPI001FAB1C82|nr:DUF4229 domain-containing protein [Streptomyces sp. 891-h]UNZ17894.1 DUF4229 domain-containing protein [Streptomyces sp. 891-h]